MLTLLHYVPYLIGTAALMLAAAVALGSAEPKRNVHPRPLRQRYYRWDDISDRR